MELLFHDDHFVFDNKVTAELKSRMMYAGNLMVSYQPLDDKPNFFRSIISNQVFFLFLKKSFHLQPGFLSISLVKVLTSYQACNEEDIDFMLEELDRLGIDL